VIRSVELTDTPYLLMTNRPLLNALLAAGALAAVTCAGPAQSAAKPALEAAHGMVVSAQHLASDVGVEILKEGGNAVDAAVAVGYAEAVTNPCCGNIGGGGFMLIHLAKSGRNVFVNFRETAPSGASADMYLGPDGNPIRGASVDGYRSVAVPGTVLGLETALARYGSLPRARVMAPAIRLAREGFILTRGDTDIIDAGARRFRRDPEAARVFLHADGSAYQPGERLVQPDLARTLESIARGGSDAFYKDGAGATNAARLAQAMREHGGLVTTQDLAAYTVTMSEPVYCRYRGLQIAAAPPPSSGGTTLCEILQILEGYDLKDMGFHSAAAVHVMTEAMRHAYVDRNSLLGDPQFVRNPVAKLLTPEYAALIRAQIDPERAGSSALIRPGTPPHEKPETTHYSVADSAGNAVSVTYTINGLFGAAVMAPGTGYMLNDEMDDFTVKPGVPNLFGLVQGAANAIAPGKRPLSSMSPTLVLRDGKVVMVLGSPGGSRIITITLQVLLNLIDYGMEPQEAVNATRIHHQWLPDVIDAEPYALSADTVQALQARGYTIVEQSPWGAAELIMIPQVSSGTDRPSSGSDSALGGRLRAGMMYGASDDRRAAGSAAGY
jgi:gamma-glutamyltranspeptidase / glutathione hydrolase